MPSRAKIAKALDRKDAELADLEKYYGPQYEAGIYQTKY